MRGLHPLADPGAVAEDKTKSKVQHEASDFVKDEYLIAQYEYQTETSCSDKVKGRLRSHVYNFGKKFAHIVIF